MSTCLKPSFGLNKFIASYLKDIKKYEQRLTAEEERKLITDMIQGDTCSFEKLFFSTQYIVFEEVLYIYPCQMEITDLIQEANLACLNALTNCTTVNNLKSYLHHNIYRHLDNYIKSYSLNIRYPINVIAEIDIIREHINNSKSVLDDLTDINKLVRELEQLTEHSRFVFGFFDDTYSNRFDTFVYRIDIDMDNELISQDKDPDYTLIDDSLKTEIERSLYTLTERDAEIIKLYFGLNKDNSMTLEEIGERFNFTRERIRQIREQAIRRMRVPSRSNILKCYMVSQNKDKISSSKEKSYYLNTLFEDDGYALDVLNNFVKPYRRVTAYPHLDNQSAECRRIIKDVLIKNRKPVKADDIKYMIWELYPEISDSIIQYSISTTPDVIAIKKGLFALKEWGYFEDDISNSIERMDRKKYLENIISILKQQQTPIGLNYLLSKLTIHNNRKQFTSNEEKIIQKILKKDEKIIKTLENTYYYLQED